MVRVCLLVALLAGVATADKTKARPKAAAPKPAAPAEPAPEADAPEAPIATAPGVAHGEGAYGGVVPGQSRKDEHKPKRPPPKGTLAWVGFEVKDTSSEVFLQSVAPFEVAQHVENGVLVVNLSGLYQLGQNTWRPVDTRFFATPLSRIVARRVGATRGKNGHGAGIEVRIAFKNPKDAHEGALRTTTEADGMFYAYLSFAGGAPAEPAITEPEK